MHRLHSQSSHSLVIPGPKASTHTSMLHASTLSTTGLGGEAHERTSMQHSRSRSAFLVMKNNNPQEKAQESGQTSYVWDGAAERKFKEHKEESRARMYKIVKSSSFNEVAFSPFIVASHMEEKNKVQRETKLQHYREGEVLPSEDYNYLANTSMLLNSCSDKHFIQTVVNNLEPEIVDAVNNIFIVASVFYLLVLD